MCYSFCGILTLQVGSVILAAVFMTVGALSLAENVFDLRSGPNGEFPIGLILVVIFVILVVVAGIVMLLAAYNESKGQCMAAMAILILAMVYWLILSLVSFANVPSLLRKVCVGDRCAESFWLIDLEYRGHWRSEELKRTVTDSVTVTGDIITAIPPRPEETTLTTKQATSTTGETILTTDREIRKRYAYSNVNNENDLRKQDSYTFFNSLKQPSELGLEKEYYRFKRQAEPAATPGTTIAPADATSMPITDEVPKPTTEEGGETKTGITSEMSTESLVESDDETKTEPQNVIQPHEVESSNEKEEEDEEEEEDKETEISDGETTYEFGPALAGAIIMFVANLAFFIWGILNMYSYAQEIKWNELYEEEE